MNTKSDMMVKIEEAIKSIKQVSDFEPEIGIILGTGLGDLADKIKAEHVIPYEEIPHFPVSTVEFHKGKLILGELSGRKIIAMQGRFHYYEGYDFKQITFPVRVMKFMGIKTLIISNACGSLNPYIPKGSIMLIDDHINLLGSNPLVGTNDENIGPRFPDMSEPYSKKLIEIAEQTALENKIKVYKGVYVAMTGPMLETRAEYRFLRTIGADVVGMSTVPENIAARHMDLDVMGISIVTDECYPDSLKKTSLDEIIETASKTEPFMTQLVSEVVKKI
jgi:purine-nucleoside phosphorylase